MTETTPQVHMNQSGSVTVEWGKAKHTRSKSRCFRPERSRSTTMREEALTASMAQPVLWLMGKVASFHALGITDPFRYPRSASPYTKPESSTSDPGSKRKCNTS